MRTSVAIAQSPRIRPELAMWLGGLLCAGLLWLLMIDKQFNLIIALMVASGLFFLSLYDKAAAILLTFSYLFLMGDIRRIMAVVFGQPEQDLLLLVGPAMAFALVVPILLKARIKDSLSKAMLCLLVVMVLEIFNPAQGGLAIGLSGAIFYIAPVLWFWVGRHFGAPEVIEKLLYRMVLPLALLASLLGFMQTFVGFLPWEQAWIDVASRTYTALHLGASIRPFGFSVSATEYAVLLMFGTIAAAAAYLGPERKWSLLLPVLGTSLVLASGRTAIIRVVVALAFIWTFRKRAILGTTAIIRIVLFTSIGAVMVTLLASHFASPGSQSSAKTSSVDNALTHQAAGLAHPFDPRYSTAGLHGDMFTSGVLKGFTYPIGRGLGATTEAASKFGGDPSEGSSEIDISDMFISLGLIGGLLYLFVVAAAAKQAFYYLRSVPRNVGLPVASMLLASIGSWLIGGQYSTSSLILFLVGALSYPDGLGMKADPATIRSNTLRN